MKTAWIVDDDSEMSNAVQLMLRLLGFETRTFLDARSTAKALLSGQRPDVLLLDIHMPLVSGLDLLEFLRQRAEFKYLPVIMLTSEAADVMVDTALAMGADAYLTKPLALEELETTLRRVLPLYGKDV